MNDELLEQAAILYEQCGGAFDDAGNMTDAEFWLICQTRARDERRALARVMAELTEPQPGLFKAA